MEKKFLDTRSTMMTKVDVTKLKEITDSLKHYAKYEDFKLLYGKVVPPVQLIEQEIIEINKNFEQVRHIVKHLDENLALKANKV